MKKKVPGIKIETGRIGLNKSDDKYLIEIIVKERYVEKTENEIDTVSSVKYKTEFRKKFNLMSILTMDDAMILL